MSPGRMSLSGKDFFMALMECSFFSESIGMCTNAHVIVPQPTLSQIGLTGKGSPEGCPVLYLLHGLSDDHSIWLRRTNIERYATQFGIAVVMPNCHRSFYCDMQNGLGYWRYLSEELPSLINGFFKFSQKREDTFVAGLSMGGYGAFKLALNQPDRFASAACFSSVIRPWNFDKEASYMSKELCAIFGDDPDKVANTLCDPYYMATKQMAAGVKMPEFYVACGTEDFLYQENILFKAHLEKTGVPFEFFQEPGTHEWGFWDRHILKYLNWLQKKQLLH